MSKTVGERIKEFEALGHLRYLHDCPECSRSWGKGNTIWCSYCPTYSYIGKRDLNSEKNYDGEDE